MPTSGGMLGDIQHDLLHEALATLGPDWETQPLSAKIEEARRRVGMMQDIDETAQLGLKNQEMGVNNLEEVQQQSPATLANKVFSLNKFAQMNEGSMGMPVSGEPPLSQPADSGSNQTGSGLPRFKDAAHLRDVLSQMDIHQALAVFGELVSINPEAEQNVADAIARFKEADDPQKQLELASVIYQSLPQSAKSTPDQNQGDDQVMGIAQTVNASNEAIRQAAMVLAKSRASEKTVFNASKYRHQKTAQHKGLENVMMFGPDKVRVDPFTGQLVSNWHIYERNKGWGTRIGDALDVDFEAIWRANVMDKYSRPYRNADGEYVGGYINKRFEVDRNVPEGNNYQLKPGELRKPYLPEYRSTEARLQNMRSESKNSDLNPTYANKDKPTDWAKEGTEFAPFNWKKASSSVSVKTSSEVKKKSNLTKQSDFFGRFQKKPAVAPQPSAPNSGRLQLDGVESTNLRVQQPQTYSGPKPDIDFRIDDKVVIFHNGQPTGLSGSITAWDQGRNGKPAARVRVQGIPGGTMADLMDLQKVAQIQLPKGGQQQNPGESNQDMAKGGPKCQMCGTQLPNPTNPTNQRKGNLTQCPSCGASMNFGGPWTNPFNQQKQNGPFNQNVSIMPNTQRVAQVLPQANPVTMPSNSKLVSRTPTPTFQRRTPTVQPQATPQPAMPQSQQAVDLSDENAENREQGHLDNVRHSADALGL